MNPLSLLHPTRPVPAAYRANFIHLYFDILWYGVLGGSAIAFIAVYAARLGADALQIGLLNAGPAVVNLAFALPAGRWLEGRPMGAAVFWTAVFHRFFYLLWIPIPILLAPQLQVWTYVGMMLLMSIPATALAVGFNALFAEAVPLEWRGHVVGIRNALLAVTYILSSLICGQILTNVPFPYGYQIVFGIGFLGAAMSSVHLWFLRSGSASQAPRDLGNLLRQRAKGASDGGPGTGPGLRARLRRFNQRVLRLDVLRGPYGKVIAVLFLFHLTQYLPIPVFPLYWVNQLHLTDQEISLGTAFFYAMVFLGSTRFNSLAQRLGNQRTIGVGAFLIASYPFLNAISRGLDLYLVASLIAGFGFSLLSGATVNYLLEKAPEDDRPPHLAWYNLALNAAVLLGSTIGPFLAGWLGMTTTLFLFTGFRLVSALIIWCWKEKPVNS